MDITFNAYEHDECNDSQLILAISGSPEAIKEKLQRIITEMDSSYGKPCQGIMTYFKGTSEVITPIWKGEKY